MSSAAKKTAGRRSKLSMLRKDDKLKFLQLLKSGSPVAWACRAIRVAPQTIDNYRARAENNEEPYATFILDVDQARAEYVIRCLRVLDADAVGAPTGDKRERGDARSLMFILERLHPKDFAPTTRTEVTGKDGAALLPDQATPERGAALLRAAFGDHARRALKAEGNEEDV